MPAQTRSREKSSTNVTFRSTAAAPKQQEFPHRRRSVKTYGRTKTTRKMKQETLTQMDFTSSVMRDFVDLVDDDEEEQYEAPKPVKEAKREAKPRSNRRKTTGEEMDREEKPGKSKRRKTLGDSPNPSLSTSFHTQTLTQMLTTKDEDENLWRINDSQDENSELIVETPRKGSARHTSDGSHGGAESAVPSLIKSTTPANRRKRTEIPSSQSPTTPMLLRYSPGSHHSPLVARSTNVTAPSPILKRPHNFSSKAVIPDSYGTAHDSSPTPSQKSTVKATPSKRLRFNLPDDKENITPGRTKPKSPKPKILSTGRRPLQEVPDSDEEIDETEDETEDEDTVHDPESPTPRRFQSIKDPEPELERPETLYSELGEETQTGLLSSPQPLSHELGAETGVEVAVTLSPQQSESLELPQEEQNTVEPASTSIAEQTPRSTLLQNAAIDDTVDDISQWTQGFSCTQGLESQRLPLDAIHALGPQTPHSDIMVSLHPEHIAKIVDRSKNHEFRAWKIPSQVSRIWVYITRPESQLKYMCLFGSPKTPGEIQDESGLGNKEFNQGKNAAKYAYEILQVYELNNPVSLDEMKRKGWVAGAPQKYTYIPPAVVGELTANLRWALFDEAAESSHVTSSLKANVSESQELKAQLQSDADYSTQHYTSELTDEIIPSSQSPRKNTATDERDFVRPALPPVRSTSSTQGLPPLLNQRQRSFVRPSQATTVSQASSSSAISPEKSGPRPIVISSETEGSSPTLLRRTHSSLRSSQFPTRSQMLPDSLLDADIREPPPIVWDSADEQSD
ncbi:hypothetical protein F5Y19DRAFT_408607 [Xylariaceae sp. FL1651]|nr:hypothetical protein F5Y19DRAFT_408607 [Xylariaceae sp. FL1651]